MKKRTALLLAACLLLSVSGCGSGQTTMAATSAAAETETPEQDTAQSTAEETTEAGSEAAVQEAQPEAAAGTSAVIYFSGTGNTARVAETLAQVLVAETYEIVPEVPYTDEDLNYHNDDCRANQEMNDENARPAISSDLGAAMSSDTIYLGYPLWWGTAPRIINTFLESYDLSGKKIYTFCTSGSSGIERSVRELQTRYSGLNILSGRRFEPSVSSDELASWLAELAAAEIDTAEGTKGAETMTIQIQANGNTIKFELNDSAAAKSLYAQLPLTVENEDFSNNEKTFYPPQKLDVSGAPHTDGSVGTLAYNEPWGDVVLFYGSYNPNGSLYELGKVTEGSEFISQISGEMVITAAE